MGWMVQGSNPGDGARFSAPTHTGHGAHSTSCMMGTGSFPTVQWPGHGTGHPTPSNAKVKETEELYAYFHSGPLGPVLG